MIIEMIILSKCIRISFLTFLMGCRCGLDINLYEVVIYNRLNQMNRSYDDIIFTMENWE
jgi:hypothetical protein